MTVLATYSDRAEASNVADYLRGVGIPVWIVFGPNGHGWAVQVNDSDVQSAREYLERRETT